MRGGSGRCCGDNFAASCTAGQACIDGKCVTETPNAPACGSPNGACYTCQTPNVKSFFDGCNQCSCVNGMATCTERACIALAPNPTQCSMQCDGFVTDDDGACGKCLCIGGQKTNCSKCGVGSKCVTEAGKSSCQAVVPPNDPCAANDVCPANTKCVPEPKQCVTTPCPQFRCDKIEPAGDACAVQAEGKCPPDTKCVLEPKQCFTTPCPQYRCDKIEPKKACGCAAPDAVCARGETCKDNVCQPIPPVMLPPGAADGTSYCQRVGGACCGVGSVCGADETCEKNQCVKKSTCGGSVPGGKCWTCATLPTGKTSFFDGCNDCSCGSSGIAGCTKKACDASLPDPMRCGSQCDGFQTKASEQCGVCTCDGQKMTNCSKCGGGSCDMDFSGNFKCSAAPSACAGNDCKPGQVCVPEPKQCITTPCPQYRCEDASTTTGTAMRPARDGKCYSCSTPGVKSFSDGCNTCTCQAEGAACTERACIALAPPEGSCELRCDGALVVSGCQECLCIGGAKTECRQIDAKTCQDDQDDGDSASTIALASVAVAMSLATML